MSIPAQPIGQDPVSKLLWNISKQMEQLICATCTMTGPQGPPGPMGTLADAYHGSFISVIDQVSTAGVSKPIEYEVTELSNQVSIANNLASKPTRITFAYAGVYNIQFSVQFHNGDGGGAAAHAHIWLAKNGVTIANTATKISVTPNSPYVVASWNFFVSVVNSDYVELIWQPSTDGIILQHEPASTIPLIPSVILTANRIA